MNKEKVRFLFEEGEKYSAKFIYRPEGFTNKEQHPASQLKLDADWGTSKNLRFLIYTRYQEKPLIASAYKRGHRR